jgi:4-amino-4-deoxy-L-arabinose transferase-like glycosyltransferase
MNKKIVLSVVALAFFLRLGLLLAFKGTGVAEQMDALDYRTIAVNLLNGQGFVGLSGGPTESRPPVYPLFLAAVYGVFGPGDFWVKLLQCVIDSMSVLGIYYIARQTLGERTALWSGLLAAVYPPMILYSNLRLTETIFTFLLIAEVIFLLQAFRTQRIAIFACAGTVHGIATLCRSTVLYFPFFLLVLMLLFKERRRLLKGFAVYAVVGCSIISIWTVRNYAVFREFMPVNVGGGHLLWFALQKDAWQGDRLVELSPLREYPELEGVPRVVWDKIVAKRVVAYALHNPVRYSLSMVRNEGMFWYLPLGKVMLAQRSVRLAQGYQWLHFMFLAGAALGLALIPRARYPAAAPVLLMLGYAAVMHSFVLSVPRYRLPFDFVIIVLFAQGVASLPAVMRKKT